LAQGSSLSTQIRPPMASPLRALYFLALLDAAESNLWSFWGPAKASPAFLGVRNVQEPTGKDSIDVQELDERLQQAQREVQEASEESATWTEMLAVLDKKAPDDAAPNAGRNDSGVVQNIAQPKLASADAPKSRARRNGRLGREESIINSLMHLDDGDNAVGCVAHCRFGEVRSTWRECLDNCIENPLIRSSLVYLLPEEYHAPPSIENSLPEGIKIADDIRRKYRLARSSEL